MAAAQHQDERERERGASLVEYALLIALVLVVCVVAIDFFGGSTAGELSRSGDSIGDATP